MDSITVQLSVKKINKGATVTFEELTEGTFDVASVQTAYISKSALASLGFEEGDTLEVTLTVAPK
jgi:formylmethanofuran dehydrogenase subunit D